MAPMTERRITLRGVAAAAALTLVAGAFAAAAPGSLHAQSAREVMETALERYEQRMEGVQDYTVVQETMGFQSTVRMERVEREGHVYFVPRSRSGSAAARQAPQNPYTVFAQVADRASLEGTEEVDGESCHVVAVDSLEGTELAGSFGEQESFRPRRARFLVDTDEHLIRGLRVEGTVTRQGTTSDVSFEARFRDYRQVGGLLHPFRMDVSVEGLGGQMSEQERQQMEQALQRMEEMPEDQRKMMEQMMGDRLQQLEQMLASGAMDLTVEVKEIRVNEGDEGAADGGG